MSKAPSKGTNAGKYIFFFIPSVPISKSVLIFLVTVLCGEIGLGSGCMSVGRAYVSWFWGSGSSSSCCLRCLGRGLLVVYQWVLGLAGEEVIFFTCCKYKK